MSSLSLRVHVEPSEALLENRIGRGYDTETRTVASSSLSDSTFKSGVTARLVPSPAHSSAITCVTSTRKAGGTYAKLALWS